VENSVELSTIIWIVSRSRKEDGHGLDGLTWGCGFIELYSGNDGIDELNMHVFEPHMIPLIRHYGAKLANLLPHSVFQICLCWKFSRRRKY
jgi:hypothetical protein